MGGGGALQPDVHPLQLVPVLRETRIPSGVLPSLVTCSSFFDVLLSNEVSLLGRRFITSAHGPRAPCPTVVERHVNCNTP